jgi:hypothetical protein
MDIRATLNTSHSTLPRHGPGESESSMGLENPHNNGQVADKVHATFSYFFTSNLVPETKGRNVSQLQPFPPEILPIQRYRKELDE